MKRSPPRRRPPKAKPPTKGLQPTACRIEELAGDAAEVAEKITRAVGIVIGSYREPLGAHPVLHLS